MTGDCLNILPFATRCSKNLHQKVVSALSPGGVFLLEAYTPEQLQYGTFGPPDEAMMMTAQSLSEELQGLQTVHVQELERTVIEGTHHTDPDAVVQFIARRQGFSGMSG